MFLELGNISDKPVKISELRLAKFNKRRCFSMKTMSSSVLI